MRTALTYLFWYAMFMVVGLALGFVYAWRVGIY